MACKVRNSLYLMCSLTLHPEDHHASAKPPLCYPAIPLRKAARAVQRTPAARMAGADWQRGRARRHGLRADPAGDLVRHDLAGWAVTLFVLFAAVYVYEFGVQERNRIDRLALDELNKVLCKFAETGGIELRRARLPIDGDTVSEATTSDHILNHRYLWAFMGQMAVLATACILSAAVPFLTTSTPLSWSGSLLLVLLLLGVVFGWTWWRIRVCGTVDAKGNCVGSEQGTASRSPAA